VRVHSFSFAGLLEPWLGEAATSAGPFYFLSDASDHAASSMKNRSSFPRSATQRAPTFFAGNWPVESR
jgi:hypothetical protein